MTPFQIYALTGLAILALMTALWLLSLLLRDASIIDSFWGAGFVIANWLYFALSPSGASLHKLILAILVTLWGFRLSLHILIRNWGAGEDFRYQNWRREHGARWWWRSLFQVFLLQGVLMWGISVPLLVAHAYRTSVSLSWLSYFGLLVWALGFFFEAVGDWQLARFKADPANKGKLLTTGVWHYSRHPNYFGDAAQWWGFYLFALAVGGWWTIFSPILMTLLLLRVSGVAMLEKTLVETKPGYAEYVASTSAFIPWFPRKSQ